MSQQFFPPDLSRIAVNDIEVQALIGAYPQERKRKQTLRISYSLYYDASPAEKSDSLHHAIDYDSLTQAIIKQAESSSFVLLETLARSLLNILEENTQGQHIQLSITKSDALPNGTPSLIVHKKTPRELLLSMGSNCHSEVNIQEAKNRLQKIISIIGETPCIQTQPFNGTGGSDYLNGLVSAKTTLSMEQLKAELIQIERDMGRKWDRKGEVTIDIDILSYHHTITSSDYFSLPYVQTLLPLLNKKGQSKIEKI